MNTRAIGLLALVLALPAACTGGDEPVRLEPADLARFADRYDGELVSTRGMVQRFDDPEHYWIEGPEGHRVAIRPPDSVRGRVGSRVRVVGEFTYDRERGRSIAPRETVVID